MRRLLCALWGHWWEPTLAVLDGKHGIYERCSRCQEWKRGGR